MSVKYFGVIDLAAANLTAGCVVVDMRCLYLCILHMRVAYWRVIYLCVLVEIAINVLRNARIADGGKQSLCGKSIWSIRQRERTGIVVGICKHAM